MFETKGHALSSSPGSLKHANDKVLNISLFTRKLIPHKKDQRGTAHKSGPMMG